MLTLAKLARHLEALKNGTYVPKAEIIADEKMAERNRERAKCPPGCVCRSCESRR